MRCVLAIHGISEDPRSLLQVSGDGVNHPTAVIPQLDMPTALHTNSTAGSTVRVNEKQGESADAINVVEGDRF